jgi:hypothetical protein
MKSYNTIYYLLSVLLIMGGFASMAQNSYGMLIISGVCITFGVIFLIQFMQALGSNEPNRTEQAVEFLVLFIIAFIFTLRTFQIYFPFVEWIFAAAAIVLALNYLTRMNHWYRALHLKNEAIGNLILLAYFSVVLFCIAMLMINFAPVLARWAGGLAFILVLIFLTVSLSRRHFLLEGESRSAFYTFTGFKDRIFLLLSLFIIISLYSGLSGSDVIPKLYSNKFPQAYFQMVDNAETGKEKAVNGEFRYQKYKKSYDQFVETNLTKH